MEEDYDPEYADDAEYQDDDPFADFPAEEEEPKPEPLSFPDAYSPPPPRPVELHVPDHSDGFAMLSVAKESRFPARRVARSACELAKALRAAARKTV